MQATELRNASLLELVELLRAESARRLDVIVPAARIGMGGDGIVMFSHDIEAEITDAGVNPAHRETVQLSLTDVAAEQLGDKLEIPRKYWQKCDTPDHRELLARNVNHWLRSDPRSLYLRCLAAGPEDEAHGLLRAVLSDRFRPMDDIDVVMSALSGIRAAGIDPGQLHISADRSARRMYVRVDAPTIGIEAPDIAGRYTDPRTGRTGHDYPVVSAGLVIRNSDVGQGAFTITPRITFLVCTNGMTRTSESQRQVHVGGQRSEGVIDWSDETMRRELAVIESKTTDAVRTFLTVDYLNSVVDELRGFARTPLGIDAIDKIRTVTKQLRYSEDESQLILGAFVNAGDPSALGLAQAFTWAAQESTISADRASEIEDDAWTAMAAVARL